MSSTPPTTRRRHTHPVGAPLAFALAILAPTLVACDHATVPSSPDTALTAPAAEVALHHAPSHGGALVERAWGGGTQWELVKPRPPGLGAPAGHATPLYVIAPVDPSDPLSPGIEIPGLLVVGGRDHVAPGRAVGQGGSGGTARTVALQHPGWYGGPPFDAEACAEPPHDDRIGWAWVEVGGATGHPCGQVAFVHAVRLDGEPCPLPLTDEARVLQAVAEGLVLPFEPEEEGPWPFALRPMAGPRDAALGGGREGPGGCATAGRRD
jgi:hypothetical protein